MSFDINDFLPPPSGLKRPDHPDFWRITEIHMELKAALAEAPNMEAQAAAWKASYEKIGDFDSIKYHALQAAIHIHKLETGLDFLMLRADPERSASFIAIVQAFFDGFIAGAEFERRGGHQE